MSSLPKKTYVRGPTRKVVRVVNEVEVLSCGHRLAARQESRRTSKRRCTICEHEQVARGDDVAIHRLRAREAMRAWHAKQRATDDASPETERQQTVIMFPNKENRRRKSA